MSTASGSISINANVTANLSTGVVSPINYPAAFAVNLSFNSGTGTGAIDLVYAKQLSLASSTPQTLDFSSVADITGATVVFARIRALIVVVQDTTASHIVTIGGGASNPWAPVGAGLIALPCVTDTAHPNPVLITDLYTVGSSTGNVVTSTSKTVKFDPGSLAVVVNIYAYGCSAAS